MFQKFLKNHLIFQGTVPILSLDWSVDGEFLQAVFTDNDYHDIVFCKYTFCFQRIASELFLRMNYISSILMNYMSPIFGKKGLRILL